MKQNRLDKFIRAIDKTLGGNTIVLGSEYWPLKPAQITPYFEDILIADVFEKVKILKAKRVDLKKVYELFEFPSNIRNFLLTFACISFKAADKVGRLKTTPSEREDFFNYFFDVLKTKVKSDIFIDDGRQIVLGEKELKEIFSHKFIKPSKKSVVILKRFNLALFGMVWAFFFDTFYYVGTEINHGPYKVPDNKFGRNKILIANEYFNLRPSEVWPLSKKMPFERVRICNVFDKYPFKMNLFCREVSGPETKGEVEFSLIEIDGRPVYDIKKIAHLTDIIFDIIQKQTDFVNHLAPLKQVKKGAEIAYFGLKKLFDFFGEDWYPPKSVDENIKFLGGRFIKELTKAAIATGETKKDVYKIFDPRNNYF